MMLMMGDTFDMSRFAWLSVVSTGASWGILIPSKLWEGTQGEGIVRRVALLTVGLGVGMLSLTVADALFVHLTFDPNVGIDFPPALRGGLRLTDSFGNIRPTGYLTYFGFLFPALRWWKQTDPLRPARLSIWSTVVCGFWAFILGEMVGFPEQWGMMTAVATSVAIQLCSPWMNPRHQSDMNAELAA